MMVNGIYVVQNECSACVALLRKAHKGWAQHQPSMDDHDPLLRNFTDLRDVLNSVNDLSEMNPDTFLSPFLEVVKAEHTNGPVTAQAMVSVGKFIDFGLVDLHPMKTANAVESIAQAVVLTKFVGSTDTGNDESVLLTILLTLRTLMLSPAGRQLSNESVCDVMQTCFRIAFAYENSVSEVLRKMAESTLADITKLLFTRLPTFTEDIRHPYIRKLIMKATNTKRRKRRSKTSEEAKEPDPEIIQPPDAIRCEQVCSPDEQVLCQPTAAAAEPERKEEAQEQTPLIELSVESAPEEQTEQENQSVKDGEIDEGDLPDNESSSSSDAEITSIPKQRVNGRGVKFSTEYDAGALNRTATPSGSTRSTTHMPYGLPCVREVLRFLSSLANPLDRQNNESMTLIGLNLLTVAMEAGADFLHGYSVLLPLVKNELCRSLIQNLDSEKLPVFAAASRVCFLLFEALRTNLKFQLEGYFLKLQSIITSDQTKVSYEHKEMALESLVHLWRIPGLVSELYLNYDCDLYCTNLFEDLTKLLMEHAFPVVGLRSTNILSLDALLTVVDTIDTNCLSRGEQFVAPQVESTDAGKVAFQMAAQQAQTRTVRPNRMPVSESIPSMADVIERKKKKRVISEATEKFNQSPKSGIEFLKERGILKAPLDPANVATWLRSNPRLDKRSIADYICSRKNAEVLKHFVKSFPFENTRLDVSLRMFLETFRLPGEAAEIQMVMQHFSDHWYEANNQPFNHVDAAFTLAYAVIMLNTDQHNKQVRRNQQPMTIDCFKRNLSGTNGGSDFDPEMLEQIYHAIKTDEIVMPAEQTGLVRENYLWKVLLRRGETLEGEFLHAPVGWNDHDLFGIIWGSVTAALSYVFEKSERENILMKALNGFRKCAAIAAYYGMSDVFDNLVICLCKFSTLMSGAENSDHMVNELHRATSMNDTSLLSMADGVAIAFGDNTKAQMATKALFEQVHLHGDILRDGWKNVLECLLHLFHVKLLPSSLTEVEDFVDSKKWVSISRDHSKNVIHNKSDSGLLSWFGLGGSSSDTKESRKPTAEQEELIKNARSVIAECKPEQLIKDAKYLTSSALTELMNSVCAASSAVRGTSAAKQTKKLTEQEEDSIIFYLELMISVAVENKDRLTVIWPVVHRHLQWLMKDFGQNPLIVERAVVGLLRLAGRVLYHLKDKDEDDIADNVLQSLSMLLSLKPPAWFMFSRQIAYGLHDLLQANAANVHQSKHWALIFVLMDAAGAAAYADDQVDASSSAPQSRLVQSDAEQVDQAVFVEDRGYTSDNPALLQKPDLHQHVSASLSSIRSTSNEWIQVDHDQLSASLTQDSFADSGAQPPKVFERGTIVLVPNISRHDPAAFLRVGDTMGFLVMAHITPENFESCVKCLRSLIEASLDGGKYAAGPFSDDAHNQLKSIVTGFSEKKATKTAKIKRPELSVGNEEASQAAEDEEELQKKKFNDSYKLMSLKLLDLCCTMYMKAAPLYKSWNTGASPNDMWNNCWKPLLQGLARLTSDCRRQIRPAALSYLTRALLIPELEEMDSTCWESFFADVVFPMLTKLLENFSPMDILGKEETRFRAIQLVSKTLLNHLTPLARLEKFETLWFHLIDLLERFLHLERSDMLSDAVPESLKNMILVLDRTDTFSTIPDLRTKTMEKLKAFLPGLIEELDRLEHVEPKESQKPSTATCQAQPPTVSQVSPPQPQPVVAHDASDAATALEATTAPEAAVASVTETPEATVSSESVESPASSSSYSIPEIAPQVPDVTHSLEPAYQDIPASVDFVPQEAAQPEQLYSQYHQPSTESDPAITQQMSYQQQQQYAQQYAAYQQYLQQQQQYYQQYPEAYQQQQQKQYAAYYSQYGSPQQSYVQPQPQQQAPQQNYVTNPTFTLVPSPTSAFSAPTKTTATNPVRGKSQ
ncbi:hypothetical protein QR680_015210 [Steinernema hermaphroditum]|uniref:SEC7 domain-containing protein n=1 Tax=Steinernema hermaphroditum TaxID=289476 RepID=A0AA39IDS3_9BILA|nr:hypothetical protein QR680_015210 [Steinernema hermaphroditum]